MKTIFKLMRGSVQLLPTLGLLTGLTACTDYLDEFKDEYDETFTAIEEPASGDDAVSSSSGSKEKDSSSSVTGTTSSSGKDGSSSSVAGTTSSSGKVDSSSSATGSSSSSGKVDSSSSQNAGSSSSESEPLPEGVFGTCEPSKASVEMGSTVTWEFTWSTNSGLGMADIGKATYSWSFPGGSPETSTGRTSQTTYAKFGSKTAAVKVTVGDSTQEITCSTLNVSGAPITGCLCASTNVSPDVAKNESATWTIEGCKSSADLSYKWTGATADANGIVATAAVSRKGDKVTGVSVTVSNTENTVVNVICEDAKAIDSNTPELVASRVGPVSQYGELITGKNSSGKGQIYGSCEGVKDGAEVQVRGMSLYWSLMPGAMEFWTEEGVTAMVKDMNIQVVRAAMAADDENWSGNWNGIQLKGYLLDPDNQKSFVKTVVEAAIKNDIYVIIDWNSHAAHKHTNDALKFFKEMAQTYGQYDNVIFEIYSEPEVIEWSVVKDYANLVIAVIREYSDNLILVGTPSWCQHIDDPKENEVTDSKQNTAYTFHYWAASHTVGSFGPAVETAMSAGLSVFISEWGPVTADANGSVDNEASSQWQTFIDAHNLSWTNWSASKVSESSAAFNSSATKTSLQYTAAGNLVKGYLMTNPTTYTACKSK